MLTPRPATSLVLLLVACARQDPQAIPPTRPGADPEPIDEATEPAITGGVVGGVPGGVVASPPPPPPLGEPSDTWRVFDQEPLGFRAVFPHPPVVEGTIASSADDVVHVSVYVMELPLHARFLEPDAWLRSWGTTYMRMNGPAHAQRLDVAGRPSLDLVVREPYLRTTRYIHAEDRVFEVEAVVPEGTDADDRTTRFLDGFVLTADVVERPPSVDEVPWTPSQSAQGGYRVEFPGGDVDVEENALTGQRVTHFSGMFSVSYEPRPPGTAAQALAHAAVQPQGDATITEETEIEAAGLVGVEARYALPGPDLAAKVGVQRVLIADERVYRLLIVYGGGRRLVPVIDRFVSSFSLTKATNSP